MCEAAAAEAADDLGGILRLHHLLARNATQQAQTVRGLALL